MPMMQIPAVRPPANDGLSQDVDQARIADGSHQHVQRLLDHLALLASMHVALPAGRPLHEPVKSPVRHLPRGCQRR